jgi:hypothetical protein
VFVLGKEGALSTESSPLTRERNRLQPVGASFLDVQGLLLRVGSGTGERDAPCNCRCSGALPRALSLALYLGRKRLGKFLRAEAGRIFPFGLNLDFLAPAQIHGNSSC